MVSTPQIATRIAAMHAVRRETPKMPIAPRSVVMNLGIPLGVFVLSQLVDRFGRKPQLIILMPLSGILGLAWSFVPADQTALIMALGFIMVAMVYYWSLICKGKRYRLLS